MPVALYMDVHVRRAVTEQLRHRGVDVLTAVEDGRRRLPDDQLLERARTLNRVLVTQDIRFRVLAEDWQRQGRPFAGLVYGHQQLSVGQMVLDLELIAKATAPADWASRVEHLPL